MVNIFKKLDSRNGLLGILKPTDKLKTLFEETSMHKILRYYNDLIEVDDDLES